MKRTSTVLAAIVLYPFALTAQTPAIPPDYWGDTLPTVRYRLNDGQVIDTDGQLRPDVHGYAEGSAIKLYAREKSEVSFVMAAMDDDTTTADTLYRIDMAMAAEADLVDPQFLFELPGITNYYYPYTAPDGVTGVPAYERVVYEAIYPNIDFHLYSGSSGPRMCWVVWPGGDVADIYLHFAGHDSLRVDWDNILHRYLNGQELKLDSAKAYQYQGSAITPIAGGAQYVEVGTDQYVTFAIDSFDTSLPLVIQVGAPPMMGGPITTPGVCWSTYFGHNGEDEIEASTVDQYGNLYVTGFTEADFLDFPGDAGFDLSSGFASVFLSRFYHENDSLLWTDFIGGTTSYQKAFGIATSSGSDERIYIGGLTEALDFYTEPGVSGSYYSSTPASFVNGFICRFDTTGDLFWSTYFGDGYVLNMAMDPQDRLVVVGESSGELPANQIPLPGGAVQWSYGGNSDAYVAHFTVDDQVAWSTYIGVDEFDNARSVRCGNNSMVVAGSTYSPDFPYLLSGSAYCDSTLGGSEDCFLIEFNLGYQPIWGTYFGSEGADKPGFQGLAVDPTDQSIYLVGNTSGDSLDIVHDPGDWVDSTGVLNFSGFVAAFDAGRELTWSTYVSGSSAFVFLNAVIVQGDGRVFIGGENYDANFPYHTPVSGLYYEDDELGAGDGLLMCFNADHELEWCTNFGGDDTLAAADKIGALALKDQYRLYAIGITFAPYELGRFFPLNDPQNGAWFETGLEGFGDPFISSFCIAGLLTGVDKPGSHPAGSIKATAINGELLLFGLPTGSHQLRLMDPTGRLVISERITSTGLGGTVVDVRTLRSGVYVISVQGQPAVKCVID